MSQLIVVEMAKISYISPRIKCPTANGESLSRKKQRTFDAMIAQLRLKLPAKIFPNVRNVYKIKDYAKFNFDN